MTDLELQEQAERFVNDELELKENSLHRHDCIVSFMAGAKWMQEQDDWISVDDRLPNVNEMVLVFMLGRITKKPVMKVDELTQDGWRLTDAGFITHWMPLPSPPNS